MRTENQEAYRLFLEVYDHLLQSDDTWYVWDAWAATDHYFVVEDRMAHEAYEATKAAMEAGL